MKEIKYTLDHDVTTYTVEISNQITKGSGIIYHPTCKSLSYMLLDVIRRRNHEENSSTLLLTSSDISTTHHKQFLQRHLLSNTVGCVTDKEFADAWPSVIVTEASNVQSLLVHPGSRNIKVILILDCHNAINNEFVIKLIQSTKNWELAPDILCFTSCVFSDTLLKNTVIECLLQLETFYGCKFVTINDNIALRRIFVAQDAVINAFSKKETLSKSCLDALQEISVAKDMCVNFSLKFNERVTEALPHCSETLVSNVLSEIEIQLEILGESGADFAALAAYRHLVRLYTFADSSPEQSTKHALGHLVCTLAKFRKILEMDMSRIQLSERVEYFSSKPFQSALNHLEVLSEGHRAILIVQNQNTASILTLMLQKTSEQGKRLAHIKPELLINCSSIPHSQSWEDILWWERNMQVYSRFNAGETNTIVLSGRLQEMDLPCCDLVLVWDKIEDFSHFMSIKNQVKKGSGNLILFCNEIDLPVYEPKIAYFKKLETELQTLVLSESTVFQPSGNTLVFKTPSGIEIRSDTSSELLYRYCDDLPHDKFSSPWPVWEIEKSTCSNNTVCATLYLTCSSPVSVIKSDQMKTFEEAQLVALQAITELYYAKELNDSQLVYWQNSNDSLGNNLSSGISNNLDKQTSFESQLGLSYLRAHIEQPELLEDDILCDITSAGCFVGNFPKVDGKTFIHKIKIWPVSEPPPFGDNRKTVLYDLLNDKRTFAILTSDQLLKVCPFPVFMFGHELCVEFETVSTIDLNQKELSQLIRFHCGMFMKVLPIVQQFMQFDVYGNKNTYLIAPLTADGEVDWEVVQNNYYVPECRELSSEEKANLQCTPELYERTMVKPWYRYLHLDQIYLVTSVCMDMSADSCFPTEDFDSFTDYYKEKYNINLERPELPLLEAYLINTKVNGLLPRARSHKLRREEKMEDFKEHMLPELCMPLLFPAALWLKLSCLPSILHRFSRLLIIEELRRTIIKEAGIGTPSINFSKLQVHLPSVNDGSHVSKIPPSTVKRGLAIGNVKLENRKKRSEFKKPWKGNQEPVDMYRNMQALNFVEIRYFDEYLIKSVANHSSQCKVAVPPDNSTDYESDTDSFSSENIDDSLPVLVKEDTVTPEYLSLLKAYNSDGSGPEQQELLEVFSSSSSNDGVHMDRIQVLGNAFLQFVVSVYAYEYGLDVGGSSTLACLHRMRSDFMSKKNLAKFSVSKELCSKIKVLDFSPGEWIPPSFSTPPMLKQVLKEQEISPDVLQLIELSDEEQLSGFIDPNTEEEILETLTSFVNRNTARRDEMYIDRLVVPQTTAASCVEALIGTYFKSCGWQGGLKIISWLQLLPPVVDILNKTARPLASADTGNLPVSLDSLEQRLGYTFMKKTLLVQAVTHESFINPAVKGNMGTLAFLGSSILDFLTTCYIYEHFTELDSSQLWRIREILCCTSSLAYLAVRHDIHKYILSNSVALLDAIDRFVKHQKNCKEPIDDELQLLMEEHECGSSLQVEVPDSLGKLLPAIIGAVYLDSGKDINLVWDTFKIIFLPELATWRQDVPLSVVDLLKDLSPAAHQVIFTEKALAGCEIEVSCKILMDNTHEKVFVVKGTDLQKTKTHAAKLALRNMLEKTHLNY